MRQTLPAQDSKTALRQRVPTEEGGGPNSVGPTVGDLGVWEEYPGPQGMYSLPAVLLSEGTDSPNSVNLGVRKGHLERKKSSRGPLGNRRKCQ